MGNLIFHYTWCSVHLFTTALFTEHRTSFIIWLFNTYYCYDMTFNAYYISTAQLTTPQDIGFPRITSFHSQFRLQKYAAFLTSFSVHTAEVCCFFDCLYCVAGNCKLKVPFEIANVSYLMSLNVSFIYYLLFLTWD